jgi:hypothetical protein
MRLTRFVMLGLGLTALTACDEDKITTTTPPPLAGVRVVNAISDTGSVDVRMVDQVEWSIEANNINFRAGSVYSPTEAKARHIRVFTFNTSNPSIANVTGVLADTTLTFAANGRYTLLLTGSARAKTVKVNLISDDAPTLAAGQIALRTVNASTGAISSYVTTNSTDALPSTPTASNIAPISASPYITRSTGSVAVRVTDVGSTTVNATQAGPAAPVGPAGSILAAGVGSAGTAFSVYYFPRGVAGSAQTATTPAIVWFVDRQPTSS